MLHLCRVQGHLEIGGGILVAAVLHQLLGQMEERHRVGLLVAHGIVIGGNGFLGVVDAAVAVGHLQRPAATQRPFLGRRLGISLAVLGGSVVVFAQGIELVALLHGLFRSASCQEQHRHRYIYNKV